MREVTIQAIKANNDENCLPRGHFCVKFLPCLPVEVTNKFFCNTQREALMNRLPIMMTQNFTQKPTCKLCRYDIHLLTHIFFTSNSAHEWSFYPRFRHKLLLPPAYVVCGKVMFSLMFVCQSVKLWVGSYVNFAHDALGIL